MCVRACGMPVANQFSVIQEYGHGIRVVGIGGFGYQPHTKHDFFAAFAPPLRHATEGYLTVGFANDS